MAGELAIRDSPRRLCRRILQRRRDRSTNRQGRGASCGAVLRLFAGLSAWLFAGLFAGLSVACGEPESSCQPLLAAQRFAEAAPVCSAAFAAGGGVDSGYAAARAHLAQGQDDAVLAWSQRLAGSAREADALRLAATVLRRRGEVDAVRSALHRALELDRSGDAERGASQEAWTLYSLAHLEWEQTRYLPALSFALEAAAVARRRGEARMERLSLEVQQGVLSAVGDLRGAAEAQERREALLGDTADAAERAYLLAQRGDLWLDSGRLSLARDATRRAIDAAEEAASLPAAFYRSAHLNLVAIALRSGELVAARGQLDAAWRHRGSGGGVPTSLLFFRASLAVEEGRCDDAAGDLESALADSPVADWIWDLQLLLGRVEEARGDSSAAEAAYRAAAHEVEAMRRALALEALKPWLLEKKRQPFEALFRLLVRQGRFDEALQTAERARARTFLDAFVRSLESSQAPASASVQAPRAAEPRASAAQSLSRLRSLEAMLGAATPQPRRAPRSLARLREAVAGRFVLSYFEADDELWRLAGPPGSWRPIDRSATAVAGDVDAFLARPDDAEVATRLGAELLPAGSLPPAGETLYIVTDGALGRLPFAALPYRGRFLVERHPLALVPSLEALAALVERPSAASGPAVVLGDPLGDLPRARREAITVAELLDASPHLGQAASHEMLIRQTRPRLLHLATHTGLGPRGPWIGLADGALAADALIAASLAPRLTVLATCASAARPNREMWGSLAAVFLAAGSDSVLASLVSVPDDVAAELAVAFYRHGGVEQPARALARAQRDAIDRGRPVAEWAHFVLLGLG